MNKEELIKALEHTEERYREVPILDSAGFNISAMCTDVLKVLKNCIEIPGIGIGIPKGTTNGNIIMNLFPHGEYQRYNDKINILFYNEDGNGCLQFTLDWWDAPFNIERSETKQELAYADQETMMPAT